MKHTYERNHVSRRWYTASALWRPRFFVLFSCCYCVIDVCGSCCSFYILCRRGTGADHKSHLARWFDDDRARSSIWCNAQALFRFIKSKWRQCYYICAHLCLCFALFDILCQLRKGVKIFSDVCVRVDISRRSRDGTRSFYSIWTYMLKYM